MGNLPQRLEAALFRRNIPALDGIRAAAVTVVILYHFASVRFPGRLGVVTFFVLSGFLITWLLLDEDARNGAISLRRFYQRRTLRIFPAFYCYWLVHVGVLLFGGQAIPWRSAWSAFSYVSNYFLGYAAVPYPRIMVHTWSLSVEEQFYLLWPCVFVWLRRRPVLLASVLGGMIVAVEAWRPIALWWLKVEERRVDYPFESRCDALLIGCLLAVVLRHGFLSRVVRLLTGSPYLPAVTLLGVGGLAFAVAESRTFEIGAGYTLAAYLSAILMIQLIAWHDAAPWSALDWSPVRYIGRISYPLYLYHILTMELGDWMLPGAKWRYQLLWGAGATVVCASASYFLVERPLLKRKRKTGTAPVAVQTPSEAFS